MTSGVFCIIAAGIIGEALLVVLIKYGFDTSSIAISDKRTNLITESATKSGRLVANTEQITSNTQKILLAIKPQDMGALMEVIDNYISVGQSVISFAGGKTTATTEK